MTDGIMIAICLATKLYYLLDCRTGGLAITIIAGIPPGDMRTFGAIILAGIGIIAMFHLAQVELLTLQEFSRFLNSFDEK